MVLLRLAAAAVADVLIAGVVLYVGSRFWRRPATPAARQALRLFGLWWVGLATIGLVNALWEAAAAFGLEGGGIFPLLVAGVYAYVLALCVCVWGMLYYLAYLVTGRTSLFWPLTIFYGAYAVAAWVLLAQLHPVGLNVARWFVGWNYASAGATADLYAGAVALLLLPQLAAVVGYASLVFRVHEPLARRRIAVTTSSLFLWLALPVVGELLRLGRFEAWQAGSRLIGLAAALAILLAYRGSPGFPAFGRPVQEGA